MHESFDRVNPEIDLLRRKALGVYNGMESTDFTAIERIATSYRATIRLAKYVGYTAPQAAAGTNTSASTAKPKAKRVRAKKTPAPETTPAPAPAELTS